MGVSAAIGIGSLVVGGISAAVQSDNASKARRQAKRQNDALLSQQKEQAEKLEKQQEAQKIERDAIAKRDEQKRSLLDRSGTNINSRAGLLSGNLGENNDLDSFADAVGKIKNSTLLGL